MFKLALLYVSHFFPVLPDWIPTLTARCFEMIVKVLLEFILERKKVLTRTKQEPSEAKYRLFYALLVLDKKPKEEGIEDGKA